MSAPSREPRLGNYNHRECFPVRSLGRLLVGPECATPSSRGQWRPPESRGMSLFRSEELR